MSAVRGFHRWTVVMATVVAALLVGAVATTAQSPGPSVAAGSSPAVAGDTSFIYAQTSPGVSNVTTLAAIDALRAQGFDIEVVELANPDLVIQGVTSGQFQFGRGGTPEIAIQQGADIRSVVGAAGNEWTVYADNDIADCAGLNGRRVGIQSQTGGSTARLRGWLEANCPGTTPEYVVIEGSQNRYAALLADRIDGSPLELADAVRLELEASDRFHLLANLAETQILPTQIYGNNSYMQANPEVVQAFIEALLTEHRKIAADPEYLVTLITTYVPEQENIEEIADRYASVGIFDVNGSLTEEVLQGMVAFYEAAGFTQPGLTPADIADLSYLQAVLTKIGEQ
jgi:NitT/TauT family transport system substrate-binding protein